MSLLGLTISQSGGHMITLLELWDQHARKPQLKVRYKDWNHRWKHFVIEGIDETGKFLLGVLDSGESIRYSAQSRHWKIYEDGDEETARAV